MRIRRVNKWRDGQGISRSRNEVGFVGGVWGLGSSEKRILNCDVWAVSDSCEVLSRNVVDIVCRR